MPPSAERVADGNRLGAGGRAHHRQDADLDDAFGDRLARHRDTLAVPPCIARSTSVRVAMLVSPGVVIASAPWAAPHSTAHCGPRPVIKP